MEKGFWGTMVVFSLLCMGATCCLADDKLAVADNGEGASSAVSSSVMAGNTDFLGFRFGMKKSDFLKMCLNTDGTLAAQNTEIGGDTTWNYWPGEYFRLDELFNKSLFGGYNDSDNYKNKEYDKYAMDFLPKLLEADQVEIINMDVYRQNASSLGIKPPPMNIGKIQVLFWKSRLLAIRFGSNDQGELTEALKKKYGCAKYGDEYSRNLLYLCVNTDRAIKLANKPGDFCYSFSPDGREGLGVAYRPLLKEAIDDACKVWKEMLKQQRNQEKQKNKQLLDAI